MTDTATTVPKGCVIRISDLDAPIYRIFPLWHFEEVVRLQRSIFVQPRRWDDPMEVVGDAIAVSYRDGQHRPPEIINQSLPPAYAQCWSLTEESDTLLRAYSRVVKDPLFGRNTCPRDEGVRVRSTPRRLLDVFRRGTPKGVAGQWFLGAVEYLVRRDLLQKIADAIGALGTQVFCDPLHRAQLLLLKRVGFSHEAEVRAIFVRHDSAPGEDLLTIQLDANEVFDEISFDPRLDPSERKEREVLFRSLGYSGTFGESDLYVRTLLEVVLPSQSKA